MTNQKWLIQPGESRVIDCASVHSLKVGLLGGQVDIIGHDEPEARVEVHSVSGRDLKITLDDGKLEIDHPQLRWDNFLSSMRSSARADVSVLVPRDVALNFGVVSASALVSGLVTSAKLSTVSGELVVDELVGNIDVNSVSGEISLRGHAGRVNAHTVSGDITATGAITRFNAKGVSGNVMLDITGTPDEIQINTVSGDNTIRLPEALGARYRVNTVSGRIQLDDIVVVGAIGKAFVQNTGNLDGSWVDVTVKTVSGNLSVVSDTARSEPNQATA